MTDHALLPGRWPMVGRDDELCRFAAATRQAGIRAFLIHGPAGVGKTRLADECLAAAERDGRLTARATATRAAAAVPLSAVAHLLPPGSDVTDLDPVRLFDQARRAIRDRVDGRLVLFIDDLPALDAVSLILLNQLVEGELVFLVATMRTGEPVPDAVAPLWATDRSVRVDLPSLRRADVDALLESVLGGPISVSSLAEIFETCQGNVLYLHELVLGALHNGALCEDGGVWRLTRPLAGTPRLVELVEQRIRSVDDAGREVLERLALCQPIGLDELLRITDLDVLDRLESAGLIELTVRRRRHEVTLAHPLHGQSLRARLSRIRSRAFLLDQANRVQEHGARRREDPLRVATWQLAATGTADPRLLLRAAQLARYAHDFARVEEFARGALAEEPTAGAALLLGEALLERGRFDEAEEALLTATGLPAPPEQVQRIALARAANLYWGLLRPDRAFAVLDEMRARTPEALHAELDAMRAAILTFCDQPGAALAALAAAPSSRGAALTPLRSLGTAAALAVAGRTTQAIETADAGYAAVLAGDDDFTFLHPSIQLMNRSIALHEAGRLAEAGQVLTEALDQAVADDVAHATSMYLWYLGRQYLVRGRPRTAARWSRDAVSLARRRGFEPSLKLGLAVLTIALAHLDDAEGAQVAAAELDTLSPPVDAQGVVSQARAWRAAVLGDLTRARREALSGTDVAVAAGQLTVAAALLHEVARFGDPQAVAGRLADLAGACDSPMVAARAGYAAGVATGDPALLDQVTGQFDQMGATLFAAEAATAAAELWRGSGDQRRSTASLGRARPLMERCEGARTPPLATAVSVTPLTPREREICFLAMRGLPSRDIAEQLFLSVRTVNNHLQNAYLKLGVSGRRELAAALRPE